MDSAIARALKMRFHPVALLLSDDKPDGAVQFSEGKWGCVMWLLASAAKGKAAAADRSTFGCFGGGVGLGFGNQYERWPGGIECFYEFLSTGSAGAEEARKDASGQPFLRRGALEEYVHGERYVKTPELTRKFVDALPMIDVPSRYVVFKPLGEVGESERPEVVIFFVDPDRLSALVVLANYARDDNENVIIPYAAGCQTIGIYAFREARSPRPRAVVGLTDLSARKYIAKQLGPGLMTFAMPFALFEEMESNVAGSFLECDTWRSLVGGAEE